jgi:trans-aconitate methyltransferase
LTSTILGTAKPAEVLGIDPSAGFVEYARQTVQDERVRFEVRADLPEDQYDVVVAGLVLNFIPDRLDALRRMLCGKRFGDACPLPRKARSSWSPGPGRR